MYNETYLHIYIYIYMSCFNIHLFTLSLIGYLLDKESLIKSLRDTLRRRKDHPPSEGNEKLFGDTITSLDLSESTLQADLVTMFIDGFQATYPCKCNDMHSLF